MNAPASSNAQAYDAQGRPKGWLSPTNRRRWANFKANRRGYWSLWIFMILFIASLLAEFIANDRPILASYKGEILYPVLVDYPEEKFGGFLARTDYRDPFIQDEIEANGWILWPPIRYSYTTANSYIPHSAPTAPFWLLDEGEACSAYPLKDEDPGCTLGNMNWLGTDDQARDVTARMIYGFRISVLFGLTLTVFSALIGIAAGAVQGYFGGWTDLLMQRFIEIWSSMPVLYILLIIAAVLPPGFWILLGIMLLFSWVSFVGIVRAEFLRARQFRICQRRPGAGRGQHHDHVPPPAAQRHGGDADLPAVHPVGLDHDADLARFPRLRAAAGLGLAGRADRPGKAQPSGAMARADGVLHHLDHAVAADLHRRGDA
jgi:microcin C transport system permease protein